MTDDPVVDLITRTLDGPAAEAMPWSTRSMEETVGFSKATISRLWQTFGLQSGRVDTFKLSADPQCGGETRDMMGL